MAQQTLEKEAQKKTVQKSAHSQKKAPPEKRTLNLMFKMKKDLEPMKWIPGVIVVLILAALFGKFAVADRFARLDEKESELYSMNQHLEETRRAYADFDEVQDQYNKYNYTGYDKTLVDRLDVMELVSGKIFPVCTVTSMSISGRTVNLSLVDLDLTQVSHLIADLEADPLVASVYVSTTHEGNGSGTAAMNITLVDATTIEEG